MKIGEISILMESRKSLWNTKQKNGYTIIV